MIEIMECDLKFETLKHFENILYERVFQTVISLNKVNKKYIKPIQLSEI